MTFRIGESVVIVETEPSACESCGNVAELRPYGPPGKEFICFSCGMKDEEATKQRFGELML